MQQILPPPLLAPLADCQGAADQKHRPPAPISMQNARAKSPSPKEVTYNIGHESKALILKPELTATLGRKTTAAKSNKRPTTIPGSNIRPPTTPNINKSPGRASYNHLSGLMTTSIFTSSSLGRPAPTGCYCPQEIPFLTRVALYTPLEKVSKCIP